MIEGSDGLAIQTTVTQTTSGYSLASMSVGGTTSTIESTNNSNISITPTGTIFTTQSGYATIDTAGLIKGYFGNNVIHTFGSMNFSDLINSSYNNLSIIASPTSATIDDGSNSITIGVTGGRFTIDASTSRTPSINLIGKGTINAN